MRQNINKKTDPVTVRKNKFAILDMSDDSEEEEVEVEVEQVKEVIVGQKSRDFWSKKTHIKRGVDGWSTVRPNFIPDDDEEKAIRRELEEEAEVTVECENDLESKAVAWAEKIRESLERAEANKNTSNDLISSLDKLSFFRRPVSQGFNAT